MKSYQKSHALYERARRSLAGGVASEFRKYNQPHPLFYSHAGGSHITDVDGNVFLDFTLSQGPLILGHSPPEVLEAVEAYSREGQLFAGQHLRELELAETLQRSIPCAELLRFSLSGSEAVHTALRAARAVTGRNKFIRFEGHYHGWLDNVSFGVKGESLDLLGPYEAPHSLPWGEGLPAQAAREHILLPWNNLALLERVLAEQHDEIAALITEPVMCNNGCVPPAEGFLEGLRELCDRHDIALVFDEVITGFRLGLGGAQRYFGVTPDLAIFGKALANGYPISVIAGKHRWMQPIAEGKVIHAGTMNSSNPTVAAALATLKVLERDDVHQTLFRLGERLMNGLSDLAELDESVRVQGFGPVFHFGFSCKEIVRDYRDTLSYDKVKGAAFVRGMLEAGVRLIGRGLWYVSAAHTETDIDHAVGAARGVLQDMQVVRS